MLCSKWFICTESQKRMGKCSNKVCQDREEKREKVLSCRRYNWLDQSEHVRDFNWDNLAMPF